MSLFCGAWLLLLLQRLVELHLARKNGKWIRERGGIEVGKEHYKWMVLLHTFFFLSLFAEYHLFSPAPPAWGWVPFLLFLAAQILRLWAIASLGPYWNTRLFVLPGARLVRRGPYRWIRHPNYLAVITEFLTFPLIFGLYFTCALFSLLNLILLSIRISVEERALRNAAADGDSMLALPRLFPLRRRNG